ncbi:VCBS domain-containing protein [Mycobacterium sp. CPCC 205710]|uniref:VCBS domain-containing protein n=1 Tax=Mycobacterium deserti TaxID=2978347 RepID=A0ABT2MDK4_9MYCO|nr:VCBS domain-containing protein [Mycobacterium deserti]
MGEPTDVGGNPAADPAPQPSSSPSAQTVEVAPGVVVSNSGGAQTSTDDEEELEDTDSSPGPADDDAVPDTDGRDQVDQDIPSSIDSPATQTSAQTVEAVGADTAEVVVPAIEIDKPSETASVVLSAPNPSRASTQPIAATPVTTINAMLQAVLTPILSRVFDALPGGPDSSPLGWALLAVARRQVGVDAPSLTLATESAPALLSLAAAADSPPDVEVVLGKPVVATGAVSGQVVAVDPEGGTPTYAVTTPPNGGALVFNNSTGKFTYTPTISQRIAAALTGNATIAMTVTVSDGANSVATVVNIPVSAYPLNRAAVIGGVGGAHAIAISGTRAYVTNKAAGTVTVIDTVTNAVIRTIAVGAAPDGIAVKHDGTRIYVSSLEGNTVKVVNTTTGAVVKTLSIATPSAVTIHPNGTVLYVTSLDAGTLRKINLTYWTTATVKLPTGARPTDIVISPDRTKLYVISGTAAGGGTVALVGSSSSAVIATFSSTPTSLAISGDSKRLYVASADGTVKVVDAATRAVLATHTVGGVPASVTVSRDGSALFVTDARGAVRALDTTTGAVLGSFATRTPTATPSTAPRAVQSADGTKLYVTDSASGAVHVVSLPPTNSAPQVGPPNLSAPIPTTGVVTGKVQGTDPDNGDVLKYSVATGPKKGTLSVRADGTFTYTPTAAARHAAAKVGALTDVTADTFSVTVTDLKGATAIAQVTVNILPANKTPVVSATVGTPNTTTGVVTGKVSATDGNNDVRTYTAAASPLKGTVVVNTATGAFTYTPTATARHQAAKLGAPADAKVDTFSVTVDDGHGGVVVKTVTVSIRPSNSIPSTPTIGSSTNTATGTVTGTVKFADIDNDTLTYKATAAAKGTLTMQPDGSFSYTPTAPARQAAAAPGATTATKTDTVKVTVTDGYGGTATMTLTLTVAPAMPANSGYQAANPTLAIGTVTGKITAVNPATGVSYTVAAGPAKGLVKVDAAAGTFVYVPNVDARYAAAATAGVDTDMFTVSVTDALGVKTSVTVTVEVAPPLTSAMDQRSTTIAVTAQEMYFFTQAETDKALDLLKAAGVTNIRILVPWMGVEAFDDWWSWGAVDRTVNGAAARNIEVLAVLNSPPIWASVPNVPILTGRPANPAEFAEYAGMVATRYAGKVSAYEIWNEPNYVGFWAPGPNAAQYTEILKAAYPVIKAADPNAVVIAGSVASVIDWLNLTANPVRFVKEMYAAGAAGYFDALSFHPYLYSLQFSKGGSTINAPLWQAKEIYKLMVANGDGNKKIWATEYGQPSHLVSEDSQAAFIGDFLRTWRNLAFAGPAFIQTIKDNTESDVNAANMGLLRADWSAKPAMGMVTTIILENVRLRT